ncbi:hypothetical protein [Spirochaeta isovalerica]|uniref:Uncharacterized protein n=1 Tax=Spirochaeta isovalerica TaxID=150 RepID=A0A841R8L0_9SPIO|nr:hypothetical protein [Spirochaeta isovalerica]MBB6480233.1 hypothetical protein [Spirochaeta isovalerica]
MKRSLLILLLIFTGSILSAQIFSFYNDAFTWGFVPEWDDWETNSFRFDLDRERWSAGLEYGILTDRDETEAGSSRVDRLALSGAYAVPLMNHDGFSLVLETGLTFSLFGDFFGYEVQGGWHENVDISRSIPTEYDGSMIQVTLPVEGKISIPFFLTPYALIRQELHYPFRYNGYAAAGIVLPPDFIPFRLEFGYGYKAGESGSKTYDALLDKEKGFRLSSELDFWPFLIEKTMFFNNKWGTGAMGIQFLKPSYAPPENALMELQLLAFTHLANGVKVMKQFLTDDPLPFLYSGAYYKAIAGWADSSVNFPEGMRFSEITAGFEEGLELRFGPFRLDVFLLVGSGFNQDQFYILESTVLTPEYIKNSWTVHLGGGTRIFFPFFFQRKIGLSFEVSRKFDILSGGNWPEDLASDNPWNYMLSLAVSH